MSGRGGYAFGDGEVAARRLDDLAALHAPLTEAFLRAHAPLQPRLALDLGCGPGHTTALVALVLEPARTVGLDASPAYVERARQAYPTLEFRRHDVTQPFSLPDPDLVYARFLLAHLPDPETLVAAWAAQLAPGGRLLVEEGEEMSSDVNACARYLELVTATMAAEGIELFPGARLGALGEGEGWRVVHNAVESISASARRYAGIFLPNLSQWGPRAVAAGAADETQLARLAASLEGLMFGGGTGRVTSTMRHVVLERS
jgi:trans-aconitate 2-methyltransferase